MWPKKTKKKPKPTLLQVCGLISYSLSNGGTVSASPLTHCALPACAPSAPQTPTHRSLQSLQMRLPLLQNTDDKINYIEHRDNKTPKLITSQLFYCVLQLSMLSTYINVPIRCLVTKVTLQIKQTNIIKQVFFLGVRKKLGVRKSQLLDIY